MQADFRGEIRSFVVETFLWGKADRLQDDASFLEEGIIDSTGILELVSFMEEKYALTVEDHELVPENFDSVNKVAAYVREKLNGKASSNLVAGITVGND